jgi:hypothetical protein
MTTACVNNSGIREEFEKSVKGYNRMLRWQEMEGAGMIYMAPEGRDAFLQSVETIKKKGVSITDFRILTLECLPEKNSGDAVAEFDYYILPSNRIKTLTYKQVWDYRENSGSKQWKIKSALPAFE